MKNDKCLEVIFLSRRHIIIVYVYVINFFVAVISDPTF